MKKIKKLLTAMLSLTLALGIAVPATTFAATDPGLGEAATFSIIAQTGITGTGTISGDVGNNSTGAGITALTAGDVGGTIYSTDGVAPGLAILDAAVQANLSTANDDLTAQGSTGSIGPALDGLTLTTGVYDIGAGRLNGGVLTLNGAGIYILRASSDFISSGSIELTNGARACDVYWQVDTLATINGSSFIGTIVAGTGVHFGDGVALNGRALALGGDVTLLNNTISGPTCATPAPASGSTYNNITVIKQVINDNGGTATFDDFPLFLNGNHIVSGQSSVLPPGLYTVTETGSSEYTASFSGDCNQSGQINHGGIGTQHSVCVVTNNDIGAPVVALPVPPLIEVLKVPTPLVLPDGPGSVLYTYTVRNIGTVPMSDVSLVGDTCSPITLISGDTNTDSMLDVTETWVYTCLTTLTETHTNIVVATGWANGISATDIANATVIVGLPIVPPLINVTKVPNPLVLTNGAGMVTYTNKVTNPGTVALSNVRIADDKCSPVSYISGDTNSDAKLDISETWTYTCSSQLTQTTVNTVTASGEANGLTARDFAIVTVVVGDVPKLPSAGIVSEEGNTPWNILLPAGILFVLTLLYLVQRKQTA
ncbi:TPA: hypothetical protein DEB00_02385 [Candidatus Uhrbacteria bacterium]|nr:hypothetical protein [Candidatus Uhrbacteria bacterium]